jgi:hypothetical protein
MPGDPESLEDWIAERTGIDPNAPKPYDDHIKYIVGIDWGLRRDHTAIVVVEQTWDARGEYAYYEVGWMKRYQLRTPYLSFPPLVKRLDKKLKLRAVKEGKAAWTTYVVDCGGVGVAAVEGLERIMDGAEIVKVFITGGIKERAPDDETNTIMLPKWQLIATFSGLLETGQVIFPEKAKYAGAMIEELEAFDRHITDYGAETFAAKAGKHDDLVVAASLCTWFGSRHSPRQDKIFW